MRTIAVIPHDSNTNAWRCALCDGSVPYRRIVFKLNHNAEDPSKDPNLARIPHNCPRLPPGSELFLDAK